MYESYLKAWSTTIMASQVVAARLPMLCLMAVDPTPVRTAEAGRMIAEKQEALMEGLVAAQTIACESLADLCNAGQMKTSAVQDYFDALTAPAERILEANARRLRAPAE